MSLNFIDISSYQEQINLDLVFSQNPLDGVIVKATEGIGYVNPYCDRWVQWLIKHNKPWGFYHYLNGHDPVAEAKRFVKDTTNYYGDGVPAADYEGNIVTAYGTYYLRRFLETVFSETGIKPLVYCSLSTIQADVNGFRSIANDGFPLWLAQWTGGTTGFQPKPWQNGSYEPFKKLTMHQYSAQGKLNGFSQCLDLDIFYGSAEDWNQLAGNAKPEPVPADEKTDTIAYLEDIKAYIQSKIDELKQR